MIDFVNTNELPGMIKWLFYGDSITHGLKYTYGARTFPQHFEERVRGELKRRKDVVINTAISGNTTRDLVKGFNDRVLPYNPDVVILMIGMNDAIEGLDISADEFGSNLRTIIEWTESLGATIVIQNLNDILPDEHRPRARFIECVHQVNRIAKDQKITLVDHFTSWQGLGDRLSEYLDDSIHPNGKGHRLMAKTLLESLGFGDLCSIDLNMNPVSTE